MGSNRTFMELKLMPLKPLLLVIIRSNRTFMELKSLETINTHQQRDVLIVPLWN